MSSVLSKYLLDELVWELKDIFGIVAVIGILLALISTTILPESLDKEQRKPVTNISKAIVNSFFSMIKSLKETSRTNGLMQVYVYQFVLSFIEFMAMTFIPVLVVKQGFTRGNVSDIVFWSMLVIVWFKPQLGGLTDRFDFINTCSISLLLSCILILIFSFVKNLWLFVLLYLCLNGALVTAYTAVNGATAKKAPYALRGTALGALGFYVSLGRTTSTITLGPIWDIFGLVEVFYVTAIGGGALIILFFLIAKFKKPIPSLIQN